MQLPNEVCEISLSQFLKSCSDRALNSCGLQVALARVWLQSYSMEMLFLAFKDTWVRMVGSKMVHWTLETPLHYMCAIQKHTHLTCQHVSHGIRPVTRHSLILFSSKHLGITTGNDHV